MRGLLPLILAALALTVLTQIGGLVLLAAWAASRLAGWRARGTAALFVLLYAASTIFIVPPLAALGGRVPLACSGDPLRVPPVFCALNRHYAEPRLARLAEALADDLDRRFPGTTTIALDANFPFLDGFPMLPHLSHDDGRKLDLAFYYRLPDGRYGPGVLRSPIGYWAFETPAPGEGSDCPETWLTTRWDMAVLQPLWPDMPLDEPRMRAAMEWLLGEGVRHGVERVFLEPYLARRLELSSPLLRFQGCRAARHDDHIHLQIGASE